MLLQGSPLQFPTHNLKVECLDFRELGGDTPRMEVSICLACFMNSTGPFLQRSCREKILRASLPVLLPEDRERMLLPLPVLNPELLDTGNMLPTCTRFSSWICPSLASCRGSCAATGGSITLGFPWLLRRPL